MCFVVNGCVCVSESEVVGGVGGSGTWFCMLGLQVYLFGKVGQNSCQPKMIYSSFHLNFREFRDRVAVFIMPQVVIF